MCVCVRVFLSSTNLLVTLFLLLFLSPASFCNEQINDHLLHPLFSDPVLSRLGFPGGSDSEASACNVGEPGSIPESRRSPAEGNGYPLQYSCLENSVD